MSKVASKVTSKQEMDIEIDVHLLNRIFKVQCPAGQDSALYEAVSNLNQQLTTQKTENPNFDFDKHLAIVALNMAHELAYNNKAIQRLENKIKQLSTS